MKYRFIIFNIYILITAIIISPSCNEKIDLNNPVYKSLNKSLKSENLKGKVRQKTGTSYSVKDLIKEDIEIYSKESFVFNEKGYLIEQIVHFSDNSVYKKINYLYDENDNLISETEIFETDPSKNNKTIYKIKSNPVRIISSNYDNSNKLKSQTIYSYDTNGSIIEKKTIKNKDEIIQREIYNYDNNHNKIEYCLYDGNDKINITEIFRYDSLNRLVISERIDNIHNIQWRHNLKYDTYDNLIEDTYYLSDKYHSKFHLTYEEKILKKYIYYNANNETDYEMIINYDEEGNIISSINVNSDKKTQFYTIYDYQYYD